MLLSLLQTPIKNICLIYIYIYIYIHMVNREPDSAVLTEPG